MKTPVIINSLTFYTFIPKKREAGAALLQPPRESVDCSFHPAVRSAGSSCSSKADTIATWTSGSHLLGPDYVAVKYSGMCFPSSCFSQRTSRGLKVPFNADHDVETTEVKFPIHSKTESSSRNCNSSSSVVAGHWESLGGVDKHKGWQRTNAFGCPGLGWLSIALEDGQEK